MLLFKSLENIYFFVIGVNVDIYLYIIGGVYCFSFLIVKFNWRLLKIVIMLNVGDFIIKCKVYGVEGFKFV